MQELGYAEEITQAAFTSLEDCRKPDIAAIHGACIGGGVDLITACYLRYCISDSFFCVKEVDLAIVADLETLQPWAQLEKTRPTFSKL